VNTQTDDFKAVQPKRDNRRPLVDTRGAGAYTGLGERYIRRLRSERKIPCVRIGGRLLFDLDDLDRLIEEHREPAVEAAGSGW
jgi:excisionase family DNA binding protein